MNKFQIKEFKAQTEIYNNRMFYMLPTCACLVKANRGELKEYSLRIALTGEQPYYKDSSNHKLDSDINVGDKHISVKSGEASIGFMKNENLEEYIDEYLKADYSNTYMYITDNYEVYEMNKEEMKKLNMAIRQAESAGLPIIGLCKRQIEILESAHNEFMEQAQQKGYNIDTNLDILEVEIKQFSAMKQIAQKAGLPGRLPGRHHRPGAQAGFAAGRSGGRALSQPVDPPCPCVPGGGD